MVKMEGEVIDVIVVVPGMVKLIPSSDQWLVDTPMNGKVVGELIPEKAHSTPP